MIKITPCNTEGFHYNGFLNILHRSNWVFKPESPINIFKKINFACCCGTWASLADSPLHSLC